MERSSGAAPPRQSPAGGPGGSDPGHTSRELLTVRVESLHGGHALISLAGELDLSTIPTVEGRLFRELRSRPAVVVDLTEVRFIDSSGIGLLIQAHRATADGGAMHTVIAAGSQVERIFRLVGIHRALPLFFNSEDAVAGLNGSAGANGPPETT